MIARNPEKPENEDQKDSFLRMKITIHYNNEGVSEIKWRKRLKVSGKT